MPVANSSNITTIQILRSYSNTTPTTLDDGQLAYSFVSNTLYIGSNTGIRIIGDPSTAVKSQAAYDQANTATVLANGAYFHANGAFLKANAGYNQANTGTVLAQAAFDKANTGGVITGNVYISNDLSVANTITTNTLNISTNTSNVSLTKGTGITSWNYSGKSFSVASQESGPAGLFISPDGLNMYVNGTTGDDVNQYVLSIAWDITTATFVRTFSTSSQDSAPNDIFFKPDGLSMFIMGQINDRVFQYDLTNAWDISTASYTSKFFSVTSQETSPAGLWFKPDGTVMYIVGPSSDTVFQYDLGTAWDVSTASYANISFSVSTQEANAQQVNLSADGTKMWVVGTTGDDILEYNLGTAWNVSTATFVNNFYVGFQETTPQGMFIDSTVVNRVYIVGAGADIVYQYNTDTNSISVVSDVFNTANNARVQGNLAVQSNAYIDGALTVQGISTLSTTSVSGTLSGISTLSLIGATNSTTLVGTSATTGTTTIGGTTQTANITFGQSTLTQTTNVAIGNTTAGSTKTIDFGINAGPGSNTRINIGPTHPGANGNVTFNPATTVAIQNTRASTSNTTGALTVLGGLGVSGNVYADAIYDGGVEVLSYLQGVDNTQNTRLTVIEATDVSQNVRLDFSNTRMNISDGVNASQNVRLDFSNSRMTIIEGVDVGQNTRMAVIEGVDLSQNVRLNFSNTRMDISDGVNASQNVRLDFSNAAITIIQGVDVGQNNRMTIIEGVDVSQNARMTISDGVNASQNVSINTQNSFITIIQGVDVGQNNAIAATNQKMESAYAHANNANVTAKAAFDNSNTKFSSSGGSITGPVSIINGNDLTVTGNLIVLGNVATENVSSFTVADPLIVLGIGNYFNDVKDIGIAAHYNNGVNAHTGIIRDSEIKEWIFFEGYTPELDANNNINIANSSFAYANVYANWFKGNILAQTVRVNGLDVFSFSTAAFNAANTAQVKTDAAFAQANITIGVDATQNTRLTVIEGTDVSQNARMTISDGVNITQNTRLTVIEATDVSQNVRLDFSNTRMTIIEATDSSQNVRLDFSNTRMNIMDGVNASQNVRLDYSNTALTIAQGVDDSQNVRLNFSNTAINQIQSAWTANTVIVANSAGFLSNSVMRFDASNSQLHSMANLSIGTTVASAPLTLSKTFLLPTAAEQFGQLNSVAYNVADTNLKQGLRLNTVAQHTSGNITNLMGMLNLCTAGGVGGTTDSQYCFWARNDVSAGAFATNSYNYFSNNSGGLAGPSNQYGFYTANLTKGLLSNYGFYGAVNTGNNAFNLYMAGTAPNYLAGSLTVANNVPSTSNTTGTLVVTGGVGITGSLYAGQFTSNANSSTGLITQFTNTNNQSTIGKNITLNFSGFDTVGTLKNLGSIVLQPNDVNHITEYLSFNTRVSDTVAERARIDSAGGFNAYGSINTFGDLAANTTFNFNATRSLNLIGLGAVMRVARPQITGDPAVELLSLNPTTGAISTWWDFYTSSLDEFLIRRRTDSSANVMLLATRSGVNLYGNTFAIGTAADALTQVNGRVQILGANTSTSNTSGALTVTGGLGVSGNTYLSGNVIVANTSTNLNTLQISQGSYSQESYFGLTNSSTFAALRFNITPATGGAAYSFNTYGSPSSAGATQFLINHTSSAVNYLQVSGNTAGNGPVLSAQGSDTDIVLNLNPKGNSAVNVNSTSTYSVLNLNTNNPSYFAKLVAEVNTNSPVSLYSGATELILRGGGNANTTITSPNAGVVLAYRNATQVYVTRPLGTTAVNYLQLSGGGSGNTVTITTDGSDTNIGINITPKGNGSANIVSTANSTSNTTGALVITGGMGITGNVFLSSANNYVATTSGQSYRLGWTDNYFVRDDRFTGVKFVGAYFDVTSPLITSHSLIARTFITNDQGNNVVIFAGSSPVRIQNTAASTSNTTGALIVNGGLGLSGNLSMNLASSAADVNRITLSQSNYIYSDLPSSGSIAFSGASYYNFNNSIGVYISNSLYTRGLIRNDLGNNTVLFAGSSPVKIQNGTASSNTTSGALVVQGGVGISGALNATTKSFNIPHPTKEGKNLRYGSLEGPEFGVYVRGTLKGSNTIELPDYWTKLVDANTITVSLTPIGKHQKLSVKEVKDNTIIINSDGWFKKEIHCYYTVFGERADVDKLDVEV